ncbi:MAG TPA: hypothetical protein VNK24_04860 [Elusimicrobiota bacterium]|nr:hypothetical protein [Elusimicrobiota bacterium]
MKRVQKGSVLLQVMILGIIVAFLAAGMAAMLLSRGGSTTRIEQGNAAVRYDGSGLNILINAWNSAGSGVCTNDATSIYSCSPLKACSCTCTPSAAYWPTVVVSGSGVWPACQSSVAANYSTN